MTVLKWFSDKGVWYAVIFAAAFGIAWYLDVIPQPVRDLVNQFNVRTNIFLLTAYVLAICFLVVMLTGRRKKGER
jgi:hypothetical protein